MSTVQIPKVSETLAELNAMAAKLDNPVHRRMLEVARDHWWAEVKWDIDGIMATLTEPVSYRFHGGDFIGSNGRTVSSLKDVRAMYEGARDSGLKVGAMREIHASYGPTGMGMDAVLYLAVPGTRFVGLDVDPDLQYLASWHSNAFFPFDPELRYMLGEWAYAANEPLSLEPIDDAGVAAVVS